MDKTTQDTKNNLLENTPNNKNWGCFFLILAIILLAYVIGKKEEPPITMDYDPVTQQTWDTIARYYPTKVPYHSDSLEDVVDDLIRQHNLEKE